jgi:DNA-nicking Smr family endonuclease
MAKSRPPSPSRHDPHDDPRADSGDGDDAALFRDAVGPVRTLKPVPEPPRKTPPRPVPRMAARDHDEAVGEFRRAMSADALEAGDALGYRRDEVPGRVLQRLRKGLYAAQDELDLHWSDAAKAEALVRAFLAEARAHGYGCVRIVHGKGLHSETGVPVLKNLVDRMLRQRADVLAFHSAPAAQGGNGAVLVLLKRAP